MDGSACSTAVDQAARALGTFSSSSRAEGNKCASFTGPRRNRHVDETVERGGYRFVPHEPMTAHMIEAAELALILEGIELTDAKRRPRWQPRNRS